MTGPYDVHGRYQTTQLAPGKYKVYFGDPLCGFGTDVDPFAAQWFDDQPTQAAADVVTVTSGHTASGVGATLRSLASISGTVTDGSHHAVAGECVTAVPFRAPADPFTEATPQDPQ